MDLNDLLSRRFARRWMFGSIGLLLLLLLATRFAVLPHIWTPREPLGPFKSTYPNAILAVIDAAVGTLLTVGLTGAFLVLLIPKEVREAKLVTVHPKDLAAELIASVSTSREYFFRGRSARYFRSTILPLIEAGSRTGSAARVIWMLLPDPTDHALMESYARFRNASAFRGRQTQWTAWDIQMEILAATIAVAAKARKNPYLEFHLGLARSFSILRINMTDNAAIMTREDPKLPAFKAIRGTVFYDSYREDIQQSVRQAGEVDLSLVWPQDIPVDDTAVSAAMGMLGLPSVTDPVKIAAVTKAVNTVDNPYA
ncbi:hypothetical protein SAMN03159338_4069 [Sphingomonas sp. NFR04]|uniref:hypothetical protein n=1 Tax=Sphingomonas sp. NFR04 TaxID=1566283 RepID=UPI0008E9BEE9|nr:hypothetical protein [Sphingomonas sp. NFR04]SFK37421.1 hypothetical protein SAMN03159338_4069 [Sphingomonas sp. NFR04]